MSLPAWFDALPGALAAADLTFAPVDEDRREPFRRLTLETWERFPYAEGFQAAGRARIERSMPLFFGFERPTRLVDRSQVAVLWADPERPEAVLLSLGVGFPPPLWPSAAPTEEGLRRAFSPYLQAPFVSAHRTSKVVRLLRETFEQTGLEDLDHLLRIQQQSEQWLDAYASWRSGQLDDPWPEDTRETSMLQLRVLANRAAEEHDAARPSIALRTLWSRSILVAEAGSCGSIVFELRYEPAPAGEPHPFGEGLPPDLPVDLAASLLRGTSMTSAQLAHNLAQSPHPDLLIGLVELDSGESTTFAELAARVRAGGELTDLALSLARQEGARGLLYELACETTEPALQERLQELTRIGPSRTEPRDDESDADEGDDEDELDDDGDELDDDGDDDAEGDR